MGRKHTVLNKWLIGKEKVEVEIFVNSNVIANNNSKTTHNFVIMYLLFQFFTG